MPAQSIHAFAEKVALIVNGGEGVGRAVALQLALQGCYVIVSFSSETEGNKRALDELKSLGTLAHSVEFVDAKNLIDEVDKLFGRLDLLINCLKSDVDSTFQIETITNESIRLMNTRPKPLIVNVVMDEKGIDATKQFAQNLPKNFRANCVVKSENEQVEVFELFKVTKDDDTARVITFFLSSESKALNGQVLYIS